MVHTGAAYLAIPVEWLDRKKVALKKRRERWMSSRKERLSMSRNDGHEPPFPRYSSAQYKLLSCSLVVDQ